MWALAIPIIAALKGFLINVFIIGLIIVFFDKLKLLFQDVLLWILEKIDTVINIDPVIMIFNGFAGYMIQTLRIDDCLTVMLSALLIKFTLSLIPGI